MHVHASFCYIWVFLERNTYTTPNFINISFVIAVPKFISIIEMQELVIVKDLSYSDVRNMLQETNPEMQKEFSRDVLGFFLLLIVSDINQVSV